MSNIIKIGFLLVGAILVALVVRVVVASASHHSSPVVTTERVRVSAADLPQGLLLRDEDITWKDVPVDGLPVGAIISGAQGSIELKGALLRHGVTGGAVLVADDVILPSAPGFLAATLKPEMRAVSVAVDDVSGNAGLIQPGDYVDLLLTQQMERGTTSPDLSVSSETVVEHVRVLASGSDISRPKKGNTTDLHEQVHTVTLEVTPHMGEVVAVASHLGSLSLALRSFATVSRDPLALASGVAAASAPTGAQLAPVWAGDISRALRDLPRPHAIAVSAGGVAAPPMPRTVTVYRGSEKADSTATSSVAQGGGDGVPPLPSVATPR
jgi:pilus assembly protein CpaB